MIAVADQNGRDLSKSPVFSGRNPRATYKSGPADERESAKRKLRGCEQTARLVVIYCAPARAMRLESAQAIAYWWGISVEKARIVRRALSVPMFNEGSVRLWKAYAQTPNFHRMARKMLLDLVTWPLNDRGGSGDVASRHDAPSTSRPQARRWLRQSLASLPMCIKTQA